MVGVIEFAERLTNKMEPMIKAGMPIRQAFNRAVLAEKATGPQLPLFEVTKEVERRLGQTFNGSKVLERTKAQEFICKKDLQLPRGDR